MPRQCKRIPASARSISFKPPRWRWRDAWTKHDRLYDDCWSWNRLFGPASSLRSAWCGQSRISSPRAHAYSDCPNSLVAEEIREQKGKREGVFESSRSQGMTAIVLTSARRLMGRIHGTNE